MMTPVMPDENQCFLLKWHALECLQQEDLKKKKKDLQVKKRMKKRNVIFH